MMHNTSSLNNYGKETNMDRQKFVDAFYFPTALISVEKLPDGGYGDIRLVACNKKYLDIIDYRISKRTGEHSDKDDVFVPGSLYYKYFPVNRNFEDVCYRSAVLKEEVRTYVHLSNHDMWFDIFAAPLDYQEGDTYYCAYTATPNSNGDSFFSSMYNAQTSNDVLKTCFKLHRASSFRKAMEDVISEIRHICNAECCTVLLINDEESQYSILATNFRDNSRIKRVTEFKNFYEIASSWKDMIGEEGDCAIIKNSSDMEYYSRVNNPWYLTLVEAGVESVVLYPLRQGNELLGYIWATNFDTDNTVRIKETIELTTFFISSHISRYKVLKRLKHMSFTDSLTGLPNRSACTEYIADLIKNGDKFAVVSIDINHFKSINDSLGLEAGNQVLVELAQRWRAVSDDYTSTTSDYVTRINGDEFIIVIMDYSSEEELRNAVERYAEALSDHLVAEGCELYVSASFGYAEYPLDAGTSDAVISYANAAMSAIKKAGSSDHILRFSSDIIGNERIIEVENKIRSALENETIYFNLQPQYDMDKKLRGFEALARMKDTDGTPISPGEFIPVAEKVGLIDKVDSMVFRKAASFFSELLRKTELDLTLSLNASVRHLMKNDFIDEIKELLETTGLKENQLEIEITESILIDSADKALHCINELSNLGIKLAIDEFGTGYSSLAYLNKIPANLLKIDKSFIDKINDNESSKQYVAAMISMGHIMGLDVISEGVEDTDQLESLHSIGCDYIQGFLWGRPLSAEDAEKLVSEISE